MYAPLRLRLPSSSFFCSLPPLSAAWRLTTAALVVFPLGSSLLCGGHQRAEGLPGHLPVLHHARQTAGEAHTPGTHALHTPLVGWPCVCRVCRVSCVS
jgi:hypothetical protein